jgi:hypothetical protein
LDRLVKAGKAEMPQEGKVGIGVERYEVRPGQLLADLLGDLLSVAMTRMLNDPVAEVVTPPRLKVVLNATSGLPHPVLGRTIAEASDHQ